MSISIEDLIRLNPGVWLESFGYIRDTGGKSVRPTLNVLQRRVNQLYISRLAQGKPCRAIGVKPRKRGFSTIVGAIHYHQLMNFAHEGVIIGDKLDTADTVFRMMAHFSLTDEYRGKWGSPATATTEKLAWGHGSLVSMATAGGKATIRGKTPQFIHGCVPPGTPVIIEDGRIVSIEDVEIGSIILTHTGNPAKVIDKIGQENWKGPMIRITPWLGESICFTNGHKIPTARGIIEAQDVTEQDEVCLPIREITHSIKEVRMPETPARKQNGGLQGKGSGSFQKLDADFGFVCGYYLAEGSLHGRTGFLTNVIFTRHRNEKKYGDRVAKRLKSLATMRTTKDRSICLTTTETFYSSTLARWLKEEFGMLDDKRIPDWVFGAGKEFCRGLIDGLLSGDGSKGKDKSGGYNCQKMILTTTRSSIAMQARDIAASLGYGWSAIKTKDAGFYYGRNCKKIWRVTWNGNAARGLHQLITGEKIPCGRSWVEKYRIEGNQVFIRIRKIETGIEVPFMWDLSVAHDDHTFRTPSFAIGNTEVAHWESPEEAMDASMNAIPDTGYNTVIWESTPFGAKEPFALAFGRARWPKAEECPGGKLYWKQWAELCPDQPGDESGMTDMDFVRVFAAWYEFEDSAVRLTDDQKRRIRETIDGETWYFGERELIESYGNVGPQGERLGTEVVGFDVWEQLAWRRTTIRNKCRGTVRIFEEEHPRDPRNCFLASGNQVFDSGSLEYLQELTRKPKTYGQLQENDGRVTWMKAEPENAVIWQWEQPRKGMKYIIPVDLAEGEDQTKGQDPDRHSCLVLRDEYVDTNGVKYPLKVVARVRPPNRMPIIPFARIVWELSQYYGRCVIIPEMNNSGLAFITALKALKLGANIWQRREMDPNSGNVRRWDGWRTTDTAEYKGLRSAIIWNLHERLRNREIECCCPNVHGELSDFVDKGGRMEAGSGHDDDVLCLSIGVYNIGSATVYADPKIVRAMPADLMDAEEIGRRELQGLSDRF